MIKYAMGFEPPKSLLEAFVYAEKSLITRTTKRSLLESRNLRDMNKEILNQYKNRK